MLTAIIAIHIVVSIVLIGSVLLQAGKGASIGSTFGGASSQTLFGSAGPATFLTKITAVCAFLFMATSLYLTFIGIQERSSSIMRGAPAVTVPAAETEKKAPAVEEEKTPAAKSAPVKKTTPAKEAAPSKKASPVEKAAPSSAKEPAPGTAEKKAAPGTK